MNPLYLSAPQVTCFANDNDAYIPEKWAMEGLAILEENMVMARLVHRDFSNQVADFGDVVNTRRPGTFRAQRKTDADEVNSQDASSTNVQVPLDQHQYVSFVIKDGEGSKSFQELVQIYLTPAMQTIARAVDRGLIGQVHKYLQQGTPSLRSGRLSNMTSSNAKDFVLEAREILNKNKAYVQGRNLILSPSSETNLLKTDLFVQANTRGDGGTALENAQLGRILGFDTYLDQNTPFISSGAEVVTGDVTSAAAAGTTGSQACTVTGYVANVGEFANVAGNDQPTYITAKTDNATDTTAITLNEALKYATGAGAVLTVYKACDVKGDYAANYTKEIVVDGWLANTAPQVGQQIAFGTGSNRRTYTIVESYLSASGEQSLLLDRPLEIALSDNDLAFPGPYGSFNLAFHRDALALVTRPLAEPNNTHGVASKVGMYNDVAMRVTMQYDIKAMGTRVNLDMLYGYAVLDDDLAVVLLG